MLRIISTRLLQSFSMKNKTQNFFDMNPVYPDFGDKSFDIYNSGRKKINVLDEYMKYEDRTFRYRALVRNKIYLNKYEKFRRYSGGKTFRLDKDTNLFFGMDSDFDDFIRLFKRDLFMDKTAKSQFKETMLKLIYSFKCKSQLELIKLFRISIANSKKKPLLDKIRGNVMQEAVLKAAQIMKNYQVIKSQKKDLDQIQQKKFQKALRSIDKKIQNIEQSLRYDVRGVPKVLSNYDPKYGWKETQEQTINENYDLNVDAGNSKITQFSSEPQPGEDLQDWSIRTRINRLYFLRRLQFLKNERKQFEDLDFQQQIPLNIRNRDKIMNQIAHKYKQSDLIQIPDLDQIYREIDAIVDKVYVKTSSGRADSIIDHRKQQIYDKSPQASQFLWANISAEQILCDTMYNTDSNKDIILTDEVARQLSPSAHTQLSLMKMPINLFRHSQLDNIGIFNQYRQKLGDNLLRVQQIDFEPQFRDFSLQVAKQKYKRIQTQTAERKSSSFAYARRKTAIAQASVRLGTGVVTINRKPIQDYFGDTYYRVQALKPLIITDSSGQYDVRFAVTGSGSQGQAECMGYALAKALIKINPDHKRILAKFGFVGSDFRKKEPKKTNLYSARVRPPYVRR